MRKASSNELMRASSAGSAAGAPGLARLRSAIRSSCRRRRPGVVASFLMNESRPAFSGWKSRVAQGRALVGGGEKGRTPVIHAAMPEGGADGDEAGEILVLAAKAVGDPRAHAGAHEIVAAGVYFQERAAVRRIGTVQRIDDAQVVREFRHARKERADLLARSVRAG